MRSAFGVRRSAFGDEASMQVHRSPFTVHRSPFTVHRSPFTVHRSTDGQSIEFGLELQLLKDSSVTIVTESSRRGLGGAIAWSAP
jgi:hypothetical protein